MRVSRVFHIFYARCSERRFVNSYPDVFFLVLINFPKKSGRVLSTRVGSRIGLQEKGKQFFQRIIGGCIYVVIPSIRRKS
jgi:hypothetical protein